MTIASFGVLLGLLFASPASPSRVVLSGNVGDSLTLPCHGDPSRDVEWWFKQDGHTVWLPVAELHTGSFSPGNDFQGRVEFFHLKEPGNYSLTLSPVVYSDLGIYKCQYKDETVLSDVKLEIRVPSDVSVVMGMSASLPCFGNIKKNTSADDLDILWKRDEKIVYQLLRNSTTYGPEFKNRASVSPEQALHGNLSLTIRQTWFSDEGDYQCFYNSEKERGKPDSARLVVTAPPLSAGAVAGIVLGVLGVVLLVLGAFVVWKYLKKGKRAEPAVRYQAASAEDQKDFSSRAACLPIPDGREPPLSVSETLPAFPKPHLSMSESDPSDTELHLPVSESGHSTTEPHLPESETERSDLIEMQEKMSESVEPL